MYIVNKDGVEKNSIFDGSVKNFINKEFIVLYD